MTHPNSDQTSGGDGPAEHGLDALRDRIVMAAIPHVGFDGWSGATLSAAARDAGVEPELARSLFPRGGIDLAIAYHDRGDRLLAEELAESRSSHLRYSERVAHAVRRRLEIAAPDRAAKEAVRRAASLYALPVHAAEGARALWRTADTIWKGLGDDSTDYNWYTKRMTLSGVISATLLFWLGDQSEGSVRTWDFLDRRIADVMRVEQAKSTIRKNPLARAMFAGPRAVLSMIRAPGTRRRDHPGAGIGGEPMGGMPDKLDPGRA